MDFNKVIKEKGLKKSFVAEKIGISNVQLSQYLSNNSKRQMPESIKEKLTWFLMNN